MSKFEKVSNALMTRTEGTNNYIKLSKNTDCRHTGKYVTENVITHNTSNTSFKTLDDVIREYNLNI